MPVTESDNRQLPTKRYGNPLRIHNLNVSILLLSFVTGFVLNSLNRIITTALSNKFESFKTCSCTQKHLKLASKIEIIFHITNIFIQKSAFQPSFLIICPTYIQ